MASVATRMLALEVDATGEETWTLSAAPGRFERQLVFRDGYLESIETGARVSGG